MNRDMRTRRHSIGVEKWSLFNWPAELRDIAHRRCEGLLHPNIIGNTPIQKLLESAYLQGVDDGVTAALAQPSGAVEGEGREGTR